MNDASFSENFDVMKVALLDMDQEFVKSTQNSAKNVVAYILSEGRWAEQFHDEG